MCWERINGSDSCWLAGGAAQEGQQNTKEPFLTNWLARADGSIIDQPKTQQRHGEGGLCPLIKPRRSRFDVVRYTHRLGGGGGGGGGGRGGFDQWEPSCARTDVEPNDGGV